VHISGVALSIVRDSRRSTLKRRDRFLALDIVSLPVSKMDGAPSSTTVRRCPRWRPSCCRCGPFAVHRLLSRRRKRSPYERGHHGGGTQDAASILAAGAESVAARPRVIRPRNLLGGWCASSSARGGLCHGVGLAGQRSQDGGAQAACSGQTLTRKFDYDLVGNLIREENRNGEVRRLEYDKNYLLDQEFWYASVADEAADLADGVADSPAYTLDYTYDVAGRMTDIQDDFSRYTYTYDELNRRKDTLVYTDTQVFTLTDEYADPGDPNTFPLDNQRMGLFVTVGGTSLFQTAFDYDERLRLRHIHQTDVGPGGSGDYFISEKRVTYSYDDADRVDVVHRYAAGNLVLTSDYDFDLLGRLDELEHAVAATGASLVVYDLDYDDAHRLTEFDFGDDMVSYGYDSSGQLTSADYLADVLSDENYDYTDNGNRTQANDVAYTPDEQNRIESDGVFTYQYDNEGNRITRTRISGDPADDYVTNYGWDFQGRLISVSLENNSGAVTSSVTYTYDMYNRLIERSHDADGDGPDPATETQYIYDGNQILLELNGSDQITANYLWGATVDKLLAQEHIDPADTTTSDTYWPVADHHGTIRDILDDAGTLRKHINYDAFGNQVTEDLYDAAGVAISETDPAAFDQVFYFTGRMYDESTGLQNNLNRWYDPTVGAWISEDPIGFEAGDGNLYRYVRNSPADRVDPNGLEEFWGSSNGHNQSVVYRYDPVFSPPRIAALVLAEELFSRTDNRSIRDLGSWDVEVELDADERDALRKYLHVTAASGVGHSWALGRDVPASRLIAAGRHLANTGRDIQGLSPGQEMLVEHGRQLALQERLEGNLVLRSGYYDEFGWHYSFCMSCHDARNANSVLKRKVATYTLDSSWDYFIFQQSFDAALGAGAAKLLGQAARTVDAGADVVATSRRLAPNTTAATLTERLEANAARRLSEIQADAGSKSHFFSRHGAHTTIEQQYDRALSGLTPDGFSGNIVDSGRFLSHRAHLNAVQAAQEIYGLTGKKVFPFDAGYEVGEGFLKNGTASVRTTNVQAVFDSNGKAEHPSERLGVLRFTSSGGRIRLHGQPPPGWPR